MTPVSRTMNPTASVSPMRRFVTTLIAAAAILGLMTASAVPAHASKSSDDLAKILAGIAAIVIIGKALDNDRRDDAVTRHRRHQQVIEPDWRSRKHYPYSRYEYRELPRACAFQIVGEHRDRISYSERCLKDKGYHYRLPHNCARNVVIYGRNDRLYSARCLEDAGFHAGRGRRDR